MQVFVYGTLTDPEQVATLLGNGSGEYEFVGSATLEGFHRADGEYPTLLPGGRVEGRLLDVDEQALERLDRYEGVDRGLYVRVAVPRSDGCGDRDRDGDGDGDGDGDKSGNRDRDGSREPVRIYVGDPARLGVDADVPWTDGRSLRGAVQQYVESGNIVINRHE
ncbi:gamma-glutamylcyclotransferase [Natronorubrum sp. JWXQ-INN-674]|uniref:Gamma-glutamylcyclotransferase n=1 Tax=Natronorubrum halalkaliphilum TaxID=2691917 RepID=A0A6B0VPJ4_9EURY|nr:gamma-glutamylcyclotransferase family protein [Natronorubrum halalkaliphilum]MXV63073.1 gamma-glutamylcyclotransferase [Natronorubrum halalkaliphilum]